MRRILLTGGLGFIGSHLTRRLLADGFEVRVLDAARADARPFFAALVGADEVELRCSDVRTRDDVASALDGVDCVVHLAAQIGVRRYVANPVEVADVIYTGTKVVAEEALRREVPLCFVSSSEIYGRNPVVPWDEEADRVTGPPSTARWVYSTAKSVAEHLVYGLGAQGLGFWIVRPFNPYGPGLDPGAFITASLWRLRRGLPALLLDGGRQVRCFTYIDDIVDGISRALARPDAQGAAYNLGNDAPTTVAEALEVLAREVGRAGVTHARREASHLFGRGYDESSSRVPRIDRAKDALGWTPATIFADGVRATVAWVDDHGWWFDETAVAAR